MDKLAFLDDPSSDGRETVSETVEAPESAPAADAGQLRGPDGKFAAKEQAPADAPVVEAAAPPAEQGEPSPASEAAQPGYVPLAALLDTRDKAAAAEARAKQAEEELNRLRAKPAEPQPFIDPDEDPKGALVQTQVAARNERLEWSRQVAVAKHGEEAVKAAYEWCGVHGATDPGFQTRVLSARDPYGIVLQEYQRHRVLAALEDPAKHERLLALLSDTAAPAAAQPAPAAIAPAVPQQSAPAPVTAPVPPRSIVSAPNAGGAGVVPTGPGRAYDALFK